MVVENNGREDWVTPNIPVEAPLPISVYARERHSCYANGGRGKVVKRTGGGYGMGVGGNGYE